MKNDERETPIWDGVWGDVENAIFRLSALSLVAYGLGVADRDISTLNLAWVMWFGLYLVTAPFIVIHIGRRTPPGDRWRAAACLAYGGAPAPLFVMPGAAQWPWLVAAIPLAMIWGVVAWLKAIREAPPVRPPRVRAVVMAGAAAICGLVSLPLFAGAIVGFLMGVWDPPDIAWLAAPVFVGLCLPLALAAAYAGIKLFGEAQRAWSQPQAS